MDVTPLRQRRIRRRALLVACAALTAAALGTALGAGLGNGGAAAPEGGGAGTSSPSGDSLRFFALADTGSGNANQQAVADRMAERHRRDPVDLVLLGGDNIYPNGNLSLVESTFERPYRALRQAGVPFHAVLGNHDIRTSNGTPQLRYRPFGMGGRWYALRRGPVAFFLLDTNANADWTQQLRWLEGALQASTAPWKVVVGHHPIYSAGHYGDQPALIERLTPLFRRHGVQLYINGHEHSYERTRPINGTTYLIVGGGGAWLRPIRANARSAKALSAYSFAELSASASRMEIRAFDLKGHLIDQASLSPRS
ncbi:MAG: metallophosphoesterase [Synechococcus sp.]|nr:metallophosphoesterase [Synechococcus sp.]